MLRVTVVENRSNVIMIVRTCRTICRRTNVTRLNYNSDSRDSVGRTIVLRGLTRRIKLQLSRGGRGKKPYLTIPRYRTVPYLQQTTHDATLFSSGPRT